MSIIKEAQERIDKAKREELVKLAESYIQTKSDYTRRIARLENRIKRIDADLTIIDGGVKPEMTMGDFAYWSTDADID